MLAIPLEGHIDSFQKKYDVAQLDMVLSILSVFVSHGAEIYAYSLAAK